MFINCEQPGGMARGCVPLMHISEAQHAQNFIFPFDMLLQMAQYETGQILMMTVIQSQNPII